MPELPHLLLPRADYEQPRRKTGFGRLPSADNSTHGARLQEEVDGVLETFKNRRPPQGVNPNLILRVKLSPGCAVAEEVWGRCGLSLLSVDQEKTLILFSSDEELTEFQHRLSEYGGPIPEDQKSPSHAGIFSCIEAVGGVTPSDRIGRLFRAEIGDIDDIDPDHDFTIDVEVWDLGNRELNQGKVDELKEFVLSNNGRVTDNYLGESLVLLRVKCKGSTVAELATIDAVAVIDIPPRTALDVGEILELGVEDFPPTVAPPGDAPGVAILDSGVTSAHPFLGPAIGEVTSIPDELGEGSDVHGHGTMVAGLALYGDVEACVSERSFRPTLRLYSARVLNENCEFDDNQLILTQMREAIQYFRERYGCRVFNVSLGDSRLPYRGGKVSPWASVLDALARELDVVIVIPAGNYSYIPDPDPPAEHLQRYPRYLLDPDASIIEPATACVALTVGSLAHNDQIPPATLDRNVHRRPIARRGEPSPFTRCGPGLGGAIKPEVCEYGGNYAFDGVIGGVHRNLRGLSVVSLDHKYLEGLFKTDNGTSYAAPRIAHAAAQLFRSFPGASANLIRALLASSASVPAAAEDVLDQVAAESGGALLRLCGYGVPNLEGARASDERRAVLYSDYSIDLDRFHVYEVPIPGEFTSEPGERRISVTLAFDPPVRHSRLDYLGTKMSFRLIRGATLESVVEAFRQRAQEEEDVERPRGRFDCAMLPTATVREGGTLQRAVFERCRRDREDFGDTYYLVVRCERKWAREEHSPQRYAVVVVLEHSAEIDLYARISQRVRVAIRGRIA